MKKNYRVSWWKWKLSSVAQLCPTLCDPVDCSTPGLPVYHQLPEFAQTHVHWVGDAIQPSHPLPSPSPPAFNLSQHQGLFPMSWFFPSRGQSIGVSASTSVLPVNIPDWFPLGLTGWISSLSKGLSRVFSNTTVQIHQFFSTQPSFWSNSQVHTWLLHTLGEFHLCVGFFLGAISHLYCQMAPVSSTALSKGFHFHPLGARYLPLSVLRLVFKIQYCTQTLCFWSICSMKNCETQKYLLLPRHPFLH